MLKVKVHDQGVLEKKLPKDTAGKQVYRTVEIESKWQKRWEKEGIFEPDLKRARKPFYNLMMFPYPSAEGLHVGGIFTFGGVDTYGRFKRMQGYDVFEPIGLDGFGINAENHAIKTETHPIEHAKRTEKNFYRQLRATGNAYAWKHKVETYDSRYYKWTQWLFIELFKAGLAYRKKANVNFCPWCKTVLADEQVIKRITNYELRITGNAEEVSVGVCERCDTVVERRELEQWFFGITKYADRLLENIEGLDWTEKVKIAQRNWIGKKEGIVIKYKISNSNEYIEVFTTRPETNFGATFVALAPEHEIVQRITNHELRITGKQRKNVIEYLEMVKGKSEVERQAEGREKTGVFTGLYAINQLTGYRMPVWVSDFVLGGFGTGALVGVPGHDRRDFEFACKFGLDVKRVVVGKDGDISPIERVEQVQEEEGKMVNSGFLDGMDIYKAMEEVMDYIEAKGYGRREVTYHLRDWLISRQRYWGPPIPMIYCERCARNGKSWFDIDKSKGNSLLEVGASNDVAGWYPVELENLPVELPFVEDYKPLGTGKSPLANYPEFYIVHCPACGNEARRETDVSDTFLDSAWYFLRYISNERDDVAFDAVLASKWLPVNMYIGGAEHSVLHLLYARFISMVLHDLGYIEFEEPFSRFYAHGLIIKDGAKMSKSKGNVINPDDYVSKYGSDTLRMYLLFLGPFNEGGDFRDSGIEGMNRFLKKIWRFFLEKCQMSNVKCQMSSEKLKMMHGIVKGMTEDMEGLRFNTAISKLMIYYNFLAKQVDICHEEISTYLRLLAPFAPHMAEELWSQFRIEGNNVDHNWSVHLSEWPGYDEEVLVEDEVSIVVQVDGKARDVIRITNHELRITGKVEEVARLSEKVRRFLDGRVVRKVVYVEGKVINFVVGG